MVQLVYICSNRERANSKCFYYKFVVIRPVSVLLHMYDFLAYNSLYNSDEILIGIILEMRFL